MDKDYIVAIVDAPPKFVLDEPSRSKFTIPKGTVIFEWVVEGSTYGIPTDGVESIWINPNGTRNVRYHCHHFLTREEWRTIQIDSIC